MIQVKKIEEAISILLTIGILISMSLVLIGGMSYLLQYGHNDLKAELLKTSHYETNIKLIWHTALSFSSIGLIELGLLTLVITQIMRVALLVYFYTITHEYIFVLISLFVLLILIYSLIWHH